MSHLAFLIASNFNLQLFLQFQKIFNRKIIISFFLPERLRAWTEVAICWWLSWWFWRGCSSPRCGTPGWSKPWACCEGSPSTDIPLLGCQEPFGSVIFRLIWADEKNDILWTSTSFSYSLDVFVSGISACYNIHLAVISSHLYF